jgi:hypothetical protein
MAKAGSDPASGAPWLEMPLAECRQRLGLEVSNFCKDLADVPKFGDTSKAAGIFADPVAVVVKIEEEEAAQHRWLAGFYLLHLLPDEAKKRVRETGGSTKECSSTGRAPVSKTGGWGFEPLHSCHSGGTDLYSLC